MSLGAAPRKLNEIADKVWRMVLGVRIRPVECEPLLGDIKEFVLASVMISGAREAVLTLGCSNEVARLAAATMFGKQVEDVDPEETRDAVGELANMLGGNFKTLLKGDCRLSVPREVTTIPECQTEPALFRRQWFECESGLILVHLHWKEAAS